MKTVGSEHGAADQVAELLHKHDGMEPFLKGIEDRDSAARDTLRYIIQAIVGDQIPLPPVPEPGDCAAAEERFLDHVCRKLRPVLRKFRDLQDVSEADLTTKLVCEARSQCRRAQRTFFAQYATRASLAPAAAVNELSDGPAHERDAQTDYDECWSDVEQGGWLPSVATSLQAHLALWLDEPHVNRSPFNPAGELDIVRVADTLAVSTRDLRRAVRYLHRQARRVAKMTPRPFRKIHDRLLQLAAKPLGTLADSELRESLFSLSRDLAYSFGPQDGIADGAKRVRKQELSGAIDLLLGERSHAQGDEYRQLLEGQMQRVRRLCEHFEHGDLAAAYVEASEFVLTSARVQHHFSPERLQTILAYIYFLYLARSSDAYLAANRAVAERVDLMVQLKGPAELDETPEFDNAATLRRIKTFASVNEISWLFHHKVSGARGVRFKVRDYDALVGLVTRLRELLAYDPSAGTVVDEMLVIQAHVVRAAENRCRVRGISDEERTRWEAEREQQRAALHEIIESYFFDRTRHIPDVMRLMNAVETGEGFAVERTLDVVEEALRGYPAALNGLQTARLSVPPPVLDE